METVRVGVYRHYKGKEYEIIGEGMHSETLERFVVYRAMVGEKKLWIRPKRMFLETVVVAGEQTPRFTFLRDSSVTEG